MENKKELDEKKLNENIEEELDLDDLEEVSGGSLRNVHTRETSSASSSSKKRV